MPSMRALAPERTWYVGSFSKTISAALRFGYVVCPVGLGEAGRLTAQHSYFALARPVSDLCLDLFQSGAAWDLRARVQADLSRALAGDGRGAWSGSISPGCRACVSCFCACRRDGVPRPCARAPRKRASCCAPPTNMRWPTARRRTRCGWRWRAMCR